MQHLRLSFVASLLVAAAVAQTVAAAAPPVEMTPAPLPGVCLEGTVRDNHDGDTLTVDVVLTLKVRLCGQGERECWAPELNEPGGKESQKHLQTLTKGKPCRVWIPTSDATNFGNLFSFGRVVGDVYIPSPFGPKFDLESASEWQIARGHASSTKGGQLGQ